MEMECKALFGVDATLMAYIAFLILSAIPWLQCQRRLSDIWQAIHSMFHSAMFLDALTRKRQTLTLALRWMMGLAHTHLSKPSSATRHQLIVKARRLNSPIFRLEILRDGHGRFQLETLHRQRIKIRQCNLILPELTALY